MQLLPLPRNYYALGTDLLLHCLTVRDSESQLAQKMSVVGRIKNVLKVFIASYQRFRL